MSENNPSVRIFVKLLNEGTDVWRPVEAVRIDEDVYQINRSNPYDPQDETWEFMPGTMVKCEMKNLGQGQQMVAIESISNTNT